MISIQTMQNRLTPDQMSGALCRALEHHLISEQDTTVIFQHLSFLKKKIIALQSEFPQSTLHAVAAKANPLLSILEFLKPLQVGVETATLGEVYLAQQAGYLADRIIYDSPAKTREELRHALEAGIYINADSFEELQRIHLLKQKISSTSQIGLRVNPQVGTGKIAATSVAGGYSKFGIPLAEKKSDLLNAYKEFTWLQGIHVHIGSQGCTLQQLIDAARKVTDFITEVNAYLGQRRINTIDIGGGLPVQYLTQDAPPTMSQYASALREKCPELFSEDFHLITEFGRYIHANAGFTASRVEYIKEYSGIRTAVIHAGADLLMRHCYMPNDWPHQISVADRDGNLKKSTDKADYTIAGPLCFGGDIIERDISLPILEEGDYILIHDTGGYTLSMWSRHTSRQIPKVLGYDEDTDDFKLLKRRETLDDLYRFWK